MGRRQAMLAAALSLTLAGPARASFHIMQIEQVIGGVNGDTGLQAVQLRMRSSFQNLVSSGRLRAWDATGSNPVIIMSPVTDVTNFAAGSRVLFASSAFASRFGPTPDFTMGNLIPASYLAAGSLTWEDDFGTVYWRLSWGGAAYTGTGAGSVLNDPSGNFNPPFPSALPTSGNQAVLFTGLATAASTDNATDYHLTTGDPVFTNNAGQSAPTTGVGDGPGTVARVELGLPSPNPAGGVLRYTVALPRDAHVRVALYDLAGRNVQTLVDGDLPAGVQRLQWDAARGGAALASGVYALRLEAGGVRLARRVVLLR